MEIDFSFTIKDIINLALPVVLIAASLFLMAKKDFFKNDKSKLVLNLSALVIVGVVFGGQLYSLFTGKSGFRVQDVTLFTYVLYANLLMLTDRK